MSANLNTVAGIRSALINKQISAVELVTEYFDRIHRTERFNNFITLCEYSSVKSAQEADAIIKNGKWSEYPLLGVPVAVKDNIDVAGVPTTCGSTVFKYNIPSHDAEAITRLRAAGAIIIGKTNMDELAMGSTNESSAFGVVKNALDETKVPGGSSGGSANSVAAQQVPVAIGTDTGGSIRQPAAFCGVVGLKPTFGSVSTGGLLGFAHSLDTVGVLANNCDDASDVYNALTNNKSENLSGDVTGLTVGIADEFTDVGKIDADVLRAFEKTVIKLQNLGAKVKRVSIKSFAAALSAYHVLSSAEIAVSIPKALDDKATALLGNEVKRRMILGAYVTTGERYDDIYMQAAKVRSVLKREYLCALEECDVLLCPTSATPATPIGHKDPIKTHSCDYFLAPVSLVGLPALSVPCGLADGLPVGVQIIGNRNRERTILNAGKSVTYSNL